MQNLIIKIALVTQASLLAASAASADRLTARERASGKVTACSTYGEGCTTAPVRQTSVGEQVRLKGGTWIYCEVDCRDTLRRATVDFWHDQRERSR
jgi:hypothetical protein